MKYIRPEMEIDVIKEMDVITTSVTDYDSETEHSVKWGQRKEKQDYEKE